MNGQIYYHFLSSRNAIQDLERKMIRVSTLDTLNDPFELMPYLRYAKGEKMKHYMKIRKEISEIYGLLCFSRTWEEPLLWSHYADKHKGIALGFSIDSPDVIDVVYRIDPIREQIELTDNYYENKNKFLDLARIKYKKWEYEDESRLLIKLKSCTKIDGHYFYRFGNSLEIKEVRLGADFDYKANSVEYILKLPTVQLSAEVIPCRLERQGYKINKDGYREGKLQEMLKTINSSGTGSS